MGVLTSLVAIIIALNFALMILFVLFGQVTVRKLRKITEVKDKLGFEFASGLNIINVAQALSVPIYLMRKLKRTPLSFLFADPELMYKHTNRFDRFLARIFYFLFMFTGLSSIILVLLYFCGIVK